MQSNKQSTWGGRFDMKPAELMIQFSESVSFDYRLAPYDIICSKAHSKMLCHIGLLTEQELNQIHNGLDEISEKIYSGNFEWDKNLEDVHMNIEQALLKITPAAAKLHTARSRNDQVATDVRLFIKDAAISIENEILNLINTLVELAEKKSDIIIPGYTHLQRAQPILLSHHLLAYVEMLSRDIERLDIVYSNANVSPLGSGAIAGTTLAIDREFAAKELGFVDDDENPILTQNSMDAVADRDVHIDFISACMQCGLHMSRIAEDFILWNSTEFGFINLPDDYTTGSSLMPQKKNPDSLELIRGKSARLLGNLTTISTLVKGLPLTYNRDLQEDKPPLFDSFDQTQICLKILSETIAGTTFNKSNCDKAVSDPLLFATDLADYLVAKGKPFREAHHSIGKLVALAEKEQIALNKLSDELVKEIEPLLENDWRETFNIENALSKREKIGMPGPNEVKKQISYWKKII